MSNRLQAWRDLHALLAAFFLPVALIYAITGGLYLLGIRGERSREGPPAVVQIGSPVGSPHAFHKGHSWSGAVRGEHRGRMRAGKTTGLYDKLMLLHKARGGPAFNVLGAAFAVSMLVMYVSGMWVYWSAPSRRRAMLATTAIGVVVTVVVVVASLQVQPIRGPR